jgi:hypothetical protein
MTGPLLAGLTQSFLDALNAGAVPTIATSWQVSLLQYAQICLKAHILKVTFWNNRM